ncbi:MAG: DUF167 domain-containing protein [Treponema sp.]|jgi:uncharacterized protein (TIGR00251 family)|nr:DUF167 domain-containing protein [Treponema sp.]
MESYFRAADGMIHVYIKAVPGASKTEYAGIKDKRLKVRIAAAPEDGKANAELLKWFAGTLGCARRRLRLLSGEKAPLKTLALPPEYEAQLRKLIMTKN